MFEKKANTVDKTSQSRWTQGTASRLQGGPMVWVGEGEEKEGERGGEKGERRKRRVDRKR